MYISNVMIRCFAERKHEGAKESFDDVERRKGKSCGDVPIYQVISNVG